MSVVLEAIKAGIQAGLTADTIIAEIVDQGRDNPTFMLEILTLDLINLLDREKLQIQGL